MMEILIRREWQWRQIMSAVLFIAIYYSCAIIVMKHEVIEIPSDNEEQ